MRQHPWSLVAGNAWPLLVLASLLLGGCSTSKDSPPAAAAGDQGSNGAGEHTAADATRQTDLPENPDAGPPPAASSQLPHAGLLADLVGDDVSRRSVAGEELAADPPAGKQLAEIWRDGDPGQRRGAAFYAMGIYRGDDPRIEDAAIQALKDPDARVRGLSLELVKRFPLSRLTPLVDQVLAMLQAEEDVKNRATVARMLADWPVERDRVQRGLAESVLGDPDAAVRSAALVSLYRIADEELLLETLQKVIRDDQDPSLRRLAIARLGRLGGAAAGTARLVATSLEDEDEGVSDAAARTLTLLGPTAIPELVRALESSSARTRRLACFALGTMAAPARPAIPGLKKLLEDPEEDIRELAKVAIRNILLGE
jgi:HEAT repeat protein